MRTEAETNHKTEKEAPVLESLKFIDEYVDTGLE
jgi:hypothetical protein